MYPKQFAPLLDKSLQTLTLQRLDQYEPALIVTSEKLTTLTKREIAEHNFQIEKVIYEPEGKNTAAAIAVACRYLEIQGQQDRIVGVFSSDALITKPGSFHEAVSVAVNSAQQNKVVILGIRPERVETGFGYIQIEQNEPLNKACDVLKFHEKPNYETAEKFVQQGCYFWNAGIFIFKVSEMVRHFKKFQPSMWATVSVLDSDLSNLKEIYSAVESIAIDVAIVEKLKSSDLSCVPCDIGWSDLGSWDVLEQIDTAAKKQPGNNSQMGVAPFEVAAHGNSVFSKERKVYGFVGADDLILVDTDDALLICKKGQSQKIKELVDQLKLKVPAVTEVHNFEVRPWGQFEILKEETYYKSKVIKVEPGQRISYQSHKHRAEHWVIVKGEAKVILNDEERILKQGQHIFIPTGAKHRIINDSKQTLEFIEVQTGESFAEDDIVRYQDDYGR